MTHETSPHRALIRAIGCLFAGVIAVPAQSASLYSYAELAWHRTRNPIVYLDTWQHPTLVNITADGSISSDHGYYSTEASATTSPGYNHAKVDVFATDLQFEKVWGYAVSEYTDDFPGIAGPVGGGTEITYGVTINGSALAGDVHHHGWFYFDFSCDGPGCESGGFSTSTGSGTSVVSGIMEINYNEPFSITARLEVGANVNARYEETYSGGAFADFSHTVALTQFEAADGVPLIGASGTTYPVSYTAPIPLPPAAMLLASACAALAGAGMRGKRRKIGLAPSAPANRRVDITVGGHGIN